jgi:hypothetical protein
MAVLVETSLSQYGVGTAVVNVASASDTLAYVAGSRQLVELDNATAGSLTVVIKGSAPPAAYPVVGAGDTKDLTAGLSVVVAAGVKKFVYLDNIQAYLTGTGVVTLSGAATLKITAFKQ